MYDCVGLDVLFMIVFALAPAKFHFSPVIGVPDAPVAVRL